MSGFFCSHCGDDGGCAYCFGDEAFHVSFKKKEKTEKQLKAEHEQWMKGWRQYTEKIKSLTR